MTTPLETILGAAESALGVQYRWGGNSLAAGVDCSGLIQQAFAAGGIRLPRVSASQMRVGQAVGSLEEAQPGDLIGYQNGDRNGTGVEHVAIYLGNGQQIEAYATGEPVRVSAVRAGATFRRVLGHIDAGTPGQVKLGPNADRAYTTAALGEAPIPEVQAAAVTVPPEGGVGDDLPENATPEQTEAYIRQHFPEEAALLANDEIRYVLTWAVREDKDESEVRGALQRTRYYQEHPLASRAFDRTLAGDPAQARQLIDQAKNVVGDLASQYGLDLDDHAIGEAAKTAIRSGWINTAGQVQNANELADWVASGLRTKPGLTTGQAAADADALAAIAASFLIPVSRPTLEQWAIGIVDGSRTEDGFTQYVKNLARGQYKDADILRAIDEGRTVAEFFDPYRERIAQVLEMSPDQVDLDSTRFKDVTQFWDAKADGGKGGRRAMTMGELDRHLRSMVRKMPAEQQPMWWRDEKGETISRLREWAGTAA